MATPSDGEHDDDYDDHGESDDRKHLHPAWSAGCVRLLPHGLSSLPLRLTIFARHYVMSES
jgi:hypothetical protein